MSEYPLTVKQVRAFSNLTGEHLNLDPETVALALEDLPPKEKEILIASTQRAFYLPGAAAARSLNTLWPGNRFWMPVADKPDHWSEYRITQFWWSNGQTTIEDRGQMIRYNSLARKARDPRGLPYLEGVGA